MLYLLYLGAPVYVTFFEEGEATETAELLRRRPDGTFAATFAPSQLSLSTCNDKVSQLSYTRIYTDLHTLPYILHIVRAVD